MILLGYAILKSCRKIGEECKNVVPSAAINIDVCDADGRCEVFGLEGSPFSPQLPLRSVWLLCRLTSRQGCRPLPCLFVIRTEGRKTAGSVASAAVLASNSFLSGRKGVLVEDSWVGWLAAGWPAGPVKAPMLASRLPRP